MSAFGKRGGIGGGRPSFGSAAPMKGRPGGAPAPATEEEGGDQFPPLDDLTPPVDGPVSEDEGSAPKQGVMDRLTARQNASGAQGSSKTEGFEASVHRIK